MSSKLAKKRDQKSRKFHLKLPSFHDVKTLYRFTSAMMLTAYYFYLQKWFYIGFGVAIAVITGLLYQIPIENLLITAAILAVCFHFSYSNIFLWGAGRSHFFGRSIYMMLNVFAQIVVGWMTLGLPLLGFAFGAGYWTLAHKFAPRNGDFSPTDRWLGGAKKIPYGSVLAVHQNYVNGLRRKHGKVNTTSFLGVPLTDKEVTTGFIVFGEVRTGKSLILSMLMETLKEDGE